MLNISDDTPINKPIIVNEKITCVTCGEKSKNTFNFCPECGTALKIV